MEEWEEHQAQTIDRLLQATFGLWNALLTVNGITLTVFSALYTLKPEPAASPLVLWLIGACVVSVCLLVFNHLAMKQTYYRMGEVMSDPPKDLTPAERERDIRHALRRRKAVALGETASLWLFLGEVILIAAYVWSLPGK